jgi:hypothetical protein
MKVPFPVSSDSVLRRGLLLRILFPLLPLLSFGTAEAYMDFAPNERLFEQLEREPFRILPRSEHWAFAVDADFFKPVFLGANDANLYKYDFYHGNGYWLNFRSEWRPVEELSLNAKLDLTQGTSSNGPTFLAFVIPHVGLTYRVGNFPGVKLEFRLSDLVRQTVGTGLFVEMKETVGGSVNASSGAWNARLMVDGTGSFRLDGGLAAVDVSYAGGLLGATLLLQEVKTEFQAPWITGTLYSRQVYPNGFGYGVETGVNENAGASRIFFEFEGDYGIFGYRLKPEYRYYGKRILGSLPGKVMHNFVSYDQNDKPFTLLMNIFPYGDQVDAYSMRGEFELRFNSFYRAFADLEWVNWFYREAEDLKTVFFRSGLKFRPFRDRKDEFGFLVGNRYLNASTLTPAGRTYSSPAYPDLQNKPLFIRQLFLMANYSIAL